MRTLQYQTQRREFGSRTEAVAVWVPCTWRNWGCSSGRRSRRQKAKSEFCRCPPTICESDVSISATFYLHIFLPVSFTLLSSFSGRLLATVFLTKPPRKIYQDYYQLIQRPIALDDIKKRLDTNAYHSTEAVRADFELLFNNALEYNMKDSIIWKDAGDMLVSMAQSTLSSLIQFMFRKSSIKHTINSYLLLKMVTILTMTRRRANPKRPISTGLSSQDSRSWSRKLIKSSYRMVSAFINDMNFVFPAVALCLRNSCSSQIESSGRFTTNK